MDGKKPSWFKGVISGGASPENSMERLRMVIEGQFGKFWEEHQEAFQDEDEALVKNLYVEVMMQREQGHSTPTTERIAKKFGQEALPAFAKLMEILGPETEPPALKQAA